jgi:hypothetical protein
MFAFEMMSRTLGVTFTQFDDGSRDAMVDGHFTLAAGRTGAVEVTTAVDSAAMQSIAEIGKWKLTMPGQWAWHVWVGPTIRRAELGRHLTVLLPECERQRVLDPISLRPMSHLTDAYTWFHRNDIHVGAVPDTSHPGKVYFVAGTGGGGAVPDTLDGFPAWLADQMVTFDSKLTKLAKSGRPEQHLFLLTHDTWLPFVWDYHVCWELTVPTEPFDPPAGLSGVWLGNRFKRPSLYWTADAGWARTAEPD